MQNTLSAKTKRAHRASNNQARETFIDRIGSARELVTLLARHLDDHMGVSPDEIDWANVGDAGRLVEILKEAARGCNLISE